MRFNLPGATTIDVLDIHELAAGNLAKLLSRRRARDLFDCRQLLRLDTLDRTQLRIAFVVCGLANRRPDGGVVRTRHNFHLDRPNPVSQAGAGHWTTNRAPRRPHHNIVKSNRRLHPAEYREEIARNGEMMVGNLSEWTDPDYAAHGTRVIHWARQGWLWQFSPNGMSAAMAPHDAIRAHAHIWRNTARHRPRLSLQFTCALHPRFAPTATPRSPRCRSPTRAATGPTVRRP